MGKQENEVDTKHDKLETHEKEDMAMEQDQNPKCTPPMENKQDQENPTEREDESLEEISLVSEAITYIDMEDIYNIYLLASQFDEDYILWIKFSSLKPPKKVSWKPKGKNKNKSKF